MHVNNCMTSTACVYMCVRVVATYILIPHAFDYILYPLANYN